MAMLLGAAKKCAGLSSEQRQTRSWRQVDVVESWPDRTSNAAAGVRICIPRKGCITSRSESPEQISVAYANNSPYRFVDPDGRQSRDANWEAAGIDQPGNPVADKAAEIASTASAGVDLVDDIATDPLTYVPGAAGAKAGAAGIGWFGRMKGKFGKTDIPNGPTSASATAGAQAAETATSWSLGPGKSPEKWARQMEKRGWTQSQISEALARGETFSATNNLNPANGATRYVHPSTGRSVVIDNANQQVIHVGGDGFNY